MTGAYGENCMHFFSYICLAMSKISAPVFNKEKKKWIVTISTNKYDHEYPFNTKKMALDFIDEKAKQKIKKKRKVNTKSIVSPKLDLEKVRNIQDKKNNLNTIVSIERFKRVFELILQGKKESEIIEDVMLTFGVEQSTVEIDIFEQKQAIKSLVLENTEEMIRSHVYQYERIYNDARFFGFDRIALKALKAKEDLIAMNEEVNIEFDFEEQNTKSIEVQEVVLPDNLLKILDKARI